MTGAGGCCGTMLDKRKKEPTYKITKPNKIKIQGTFSFDLTFPTIQPIKLPRINE